MSGFPRLRTMVDRVEGHIRGTDHLGDTVEARSAAIVTLILDSLEIRALRIEDSLTAFLERDAEAALERLLSS
jgi:hypothetical protein